LFLAGGIGGALCDQIHVQSGVLSYPHPFLFDQAGWVTPQFGIGMIVILAGVRAFARRAPGRSRTALDGGLFLAAYASTGLLHRRPTSLAVALAVTWLARLAVEDDRAVLLAWSILLALGGTLYEGTLAGTGAFHYARPDLYHVPLWLPGIYLNGAALALDLGRLLYVKREEGGLLRARLLAVQFGTTGSKNRPS
jgi:hypothetical protein